MRLMLLAALAMGLAAQVVNAGEKLHGNMVLQLRDALPRGDSVADLTLEWPVREGEWSEIGWGYSVAYSRGFHWPRIVKSSGSDAQRTLEVEVEIGPDSWTKGGWARFEIELKRDGDRFSGTYSGTFVPDAISWPGGTANALPPALRETAAAPASARPDYRAGKKVSGAVTGQLTTPWPGDRPMAHALPVAGEHPRLAFRKSDLPRLRKLAAESPVAKAILSRATGRAGSVEPPRMDRIKEDKFTSHPAVIAAFAYCMTGEERFADNARAVLEATIFNNPEGRRGKEIKQDIHHAPRLLALALAYDMAYDGWDEEFRTRCTDELQRRTWELHLGEFEGVRMSGYNPNPWSNHSGIRAACAGLGAMAILDEKNSRGKVMDDAEHIAWMAAIDLRRHYLMSGVGTSGNCMEGTYYKKMTAERGLDYFPPAYENVFGQAFSDGELRDFQFVGDLIEGHEVTQEGWSVGIHSVPPELMPGFKWLLDRTVGLEGDGSFGIATGLEAAFALNLYPYDVEARPPAECFPWMVPDPRKGHWIFRPEFGKKGGIRLILNMRSEILGGSWHTRAGMQCDNNLTAFGKQWLFGPFLPQLAAVPAPNTDLGAKTMDWRATADRTCVIDFDLTPVYYGNVPGDLKYGDTPAAYAKRSNADIVNVPGWRPMVDYGVRGTRSMAIDMSGESGAPLLIAFADRMGIPAFWKDKIDSRYRMTDDEAAFIKAVGLTDRPKLPSSAQKTVCRWQFPLPMGRSHGGHIIYSPGSVDVKGSQFVVKADNGATLSGVAPSGPVSSTLSTDDDANYFVVFTVSPKGVPALRVKGSGMDARVTVGRRTVRFDGNTIILE